MIWTGPNPWYPGPKLGGGGGIEYTGGAVGAFCPGNVLSGGCISDCCDEVAPFSR